MTEDVTKKDAEPAATVHDYAALLTEDRYVVLEKETRRV